MENKQKEQLKKGLVFGGLGLLFALSMWFIFAPSGKDKTAAEQGLNDSIPQATTEQLTGNKLKAYELGDKMQQEEQAREELGRLSDYFAENTEPSDAERAQAAATTAKIENSMQRYEENTRLLNSFYASDPHEEEREAMRQEIDKLKKELSEQSYKEEDEERKQLALMEKSYQMAAKYLPTTTTSGMPPNAFTTAQERPTTEDKSGTASPASSAPSMEVLAERKQVVSSLERPMTDKEFIQEYGTKPRNLGFHSLTTATSSSIRNTLKVVVDRTTVLKEGDYVALRLMETARIKDLRIPRQSKLIAQAKIEGNRMHLLIRRIEVDGHIIAVKLSAYDTDGQEGIYIPGSEDLGALKEIGANIGGSMGTSFTFASSAKDQIISEAARGVMQGASQLLQKKLRTVKVTLKGGYRLFLVQTK
ncbi:MULTISPECIES: conjugative transposon protein TraM [Bacteroidales]|uniref:conjugative transposon protein TraM n=1 Tax=Bacteroidales TaxID=171549 RepID=UPI000365BB20|nr:MULTISPECIES: conjugative transposon protein TraM [Bacteroidales]EOA11656.1 conjugative transposon TraM protein [Porphyromonas gingivalis JCVI SC001]KKY61608.1 conjugal transfer protein TraM [Tannerella forsythia]KXC07553.1 conjugal transfer protein TraM [Porphyromonas gingivalis]PDP49389.1 conjugative transposon protein TraM [Porphyromonas gingivalis]TPE15049.1 conjugative transposon protein TraM [Tannerella forsythia]